MLEDANSLNLVFQASSRILRSGRRFSVAREVDPPSTDAPCGFIYNIPGRKKHFSCDARRQLGPATKTDRPAGAHTDDSWARLANHTLGTGTTANPRPGEAAAFGLESFAQTSDVLGYFFFPGIMKDEEGISSRLPSALRPPHFFSPPASRLISEGSTCWFAGPLQIVSSV